MPTRLHIVPHENGWALKREGHDKFESTYATQKEAIDAGRDMARQDEADLVVHRQDGTFRNVLTYTNEPMNENHENGKRLQPQDILSVGSRVSWGAILAGAAIALAVYAVLMGGGAALGVTFSDRLGLRVLTIGGVLWGLFSALLALFLGGCVVSRVTAGENKTEAVMYGVILWGVVFATSILMAGAGMTSAAQVLMVRSNADQPLLSAETYRDAGVSKEDADRLERTLREARAQAGEIDPKAAAWWGFTTMILSLGAAVGGSWLGSGPTLIFVRTNTRRPAQVQPS